MGAAHPPEGGYITIAMEQTAEGCTEGSRQKYALAMGATAVYIAGYGLLFVALRKRRSE